MLRRKLMIFLGSVVLLLVVMGAAALWMLQDVMVGQDHVNTQAMAAVDNVNTINASIARVQVELYQLQLGHTRRLDPLVEQVEALRAAVDELGQRQLTSEPAMLLSQIGDWLPSFEQHVGALATARDADLAFRHNQAALDNSIQIQRAGLSLAQDIHDRALKDQRGLTARFRWTVIVLTLVFLVVINTSIIVLLHTAKLVVEPVEKLVDASRELGKGHFGARVHVEQRDEFDELAGAFNNLGEQLEATEQRKLEVLQQTALTLNHELNNASAIIALQLRKLERRPGNDEAQEKALRQIHESLERMTKTVQDLKNVRRIVLTDYVLGVQMLDLRRSMEVEAVKQEKPKGRESMGFGVK